MDKAMARERAWDRLETNEAARFPFPVTGRIPNFAGADTAAARMTDLAEWARASAVKVNPDYAQFHVRVLALQAMKDVYVAVPRLQDAACFLHLDPDSIDDPSDAATIDGARAQGTPCHPEALPPIDLVVVGSVAVSSAGARVGKGEGYADLEFALLQAFDRVDAGTTIVTSVHDSQVVENSIAAEPHDVPIDQIVTPERSIETDVIGTRPDGIDWSILSQSDVEEIPILQSLRSGSS